MAAVDAQFYWMSAKVPNDQFLLYAFDGEPADLDRAIEQVCRRARACPDLTMRVEEGWARRYPQWVPAAVGPERVVRHDLADDGWDGCLAAVVGLGRRPAGHSPDALATARFHAGARHSGRHRARAPLRSCRWRTRWPTARALRRWRRGCSGGRSRARGGTATGGLFAVAGCRRGRTHRRLVRDTRAGLLAPGAGLRPPLSTNARPEGVRCGAHAGAEPFATARSHGHRRGAGGGAGLSTALSGLLGERADSLGAEVPMAKPGARHANNHFGNVVVGLYPRLGPG